MAHKLLTPALATLAVALCAVTTSAPAQAGGWKPIYKPFPVKPIGYPMKPFHPKPFHPKPHWGYGGAVAAGLIGATTVGILAASASDCYVVRKRYVTEDGDVLIRRVRVCE